MVMTYSRKLAADVKNKIAKRKLVKKKALLYWRSLEINSQISDFIAGHL
jgi:hypothetical protein